MPLILTSKVLDTEGFPIEHAVVIKEIPLNGTTGMANAVADPDGTFKFIPLFSTSMIEVSSVGYKSQFFPANKAIPSQIRLEIYLDITGKPTKKEDYTWLYILAGLGVVGAIMLSQRQAAKTAAPAKGLSQPATKPKTVTLSF